MAAIRSWRASGAFLLSLSVALLILAPAASATNVYDVMPAAMDQPQVNLALWDDATDQPLTYTMADSGVSSSYHNITAYFDTGASGILLSKETLSAFRTNAANVAKLAPSTYGAENTTVQYYDTGVLGTAAFNVSAPMTVKVAPTSPSTTSLFDFTEPAPNQYTQSYGNMRLQMNPNTSGSNPYSDIYDELGDELGIGLGSYGGIDVVGMPAMVGKVVVVNPKPLDALLQGLAGGLSSGDPWDFFNDPSAGSLSTYVYNPGTPFNGSDTSPGIPSTNRHVQLTYASFDKFTVTTPENATGPTLVHNPFIGANPISKIDSTVPAGDAPGVTVSLGDKSATGSFLLDTGAAASMISKDLAKSLNVRYTSGLEPSPTNDNPTLELFNPDTGEATPLVNQFQLTISGIGGESEKVSGFYLNELQLPTIEGDPISFIQAPVLVVDVTVADAEKNLLTLDGIFGMNFLVASTEIVENSDWPFGDMSTGAFNWIVFDEPSGILGLDVKNISVPEPSSFVLLAVGLSFFLLGRTVRRRRA